MNITLITKESLSFMHLPEKVSGQYWVTSSINGQDLRVMSVETRDGEWVLKSNKDCHILNSDGATTKKDVILRPRCSVHIDNSQLGKCIMLIEPEEESQAIYTKYIIRPGVDILVGRSKTADICFDHGAVSNEHCTLRFEDNKYIVTDKSKNGTFINRKSVAQNALSKHQENGRNVYVTEGHFGDVVYVFGITIILSNGFIALNNPYNSVEIKTGKLKQLRPEKTVYPDEDYEYEMKKKDFFYRSPRFKRDVERAFFKVDPPPESPIGNEMPMMLVLGPSITMGMASMSTALFAVNNAIQNGNISAALPSVIMSVSMLMGTVTWPIITKKVEKKRKKKKELKRQNKYRQYLNSFLACVQEAEDVQTEILNENFALIKKYEDTILSADSTLWERSMGQNDFLTVRVGTGECDLNAEISYQDRKFSIDDDNLRDEMYMLCEGEKKLHNIPITYSIFEDYVSGIVGTLQNNIEFAKQIITQISAMYGYDEVKMIFIYDKNQIAQLEFVKWLPHVWSNDNSFRFIATSERELKEISAYIEPVLQHRAELSDEDVAETLPVYIVMSFSKELAVKASFIEKIFAAKRNIHFCVISLYDEMRRLPKECTKIIYLNGTEGKIYDKNDISGEYVSFSLDSGVQTPMADICKKLANIKLDIQDDANKLPSMITFLEMMGVGRIDHLNSLSRWKENDPTQTLETPIGVDAAGNLFMLDLHEKFHGPHGLVAGMTGSGKSELIITYILSLAVNYHPNEVAFILIDYKGGGMANSFGRLPHTAGIITNLDGASIKRSLISIESELKRRQAIFVKVSAEIGVSNIDIYTYQKLYREGKVTEPLQHLFIISDEFAELKQQQPEFMAQLISAARIGRSLGVHLILATQKPSGVVDDQIWSNSRFRVCLKVQERADSMDMLKRPDAAELKETGRFYLQVGYNELFEIGQSAWSGASYIPSDRVEKEKDTSVIAIDNNGRVIKQMRAAKKKVQNNSGKKQLDSIVDYLCRIAEEEKITIRPLWLEPIPSIITIDELAKKYEKRTTAYYIDPIIGEYDDPVNQRQALLTLPISESGNTIIYGSAGNGKTTFLNAMLYSLIHEHTADEINLYVLDFASETLRCFAKAPQVGDVVFINETEKVVNLFKLLNGEVKKRKKAFSSFGGDYNSFINASNRRESYPMIVVVIHNFAAFTEAYEDRVGTVSYLSREGAKYGINFVITATATNTVSYRLMQNFKQMFVLQLNDDIEYSSLLGKTNGLVPSKIKGRGLVKLDNLYEFQTAHIVYESDRDGTRVPISPLEFIEDECVRIRNAWSGEPATRIPILADVVDAELLEDYVTKGNLHNVPIGIETASLKPCRYPIGVNFLTSIISYDDSYKTFSYKLASFINNNVGVTTHYIDISGAFRDEPAEGINCYYKSSDVEMIIDKLFNIALERNKAFKQAFRDGVKAESFEPVVTVISGISSIREILGDTGKEQLDMFLWKGSVDYNMYVIVCDSLNNFTNIARNGNWFKSNGNTGSFIWVGSGLSKQYILDFDRARFTDENVPDGFGYAIVNQKLIKVKLLGADSGGEGNEQ